MSNKSTAAPFGSLPSDPPDTARTDRDRASTKIVVHRMLLAVTTTPMTIRTQLHTVRSATARARPGSRPRHSSILRLADAGGSPQTADGGRSYRPVRRRGREKGPRQPTDSPGATSSYGTSAMIPPGRRADTGLPPPPSTSEFRNRPLCDEALNLTVCPISSYCRSYRWRVPADKLCYP